MDGSMSYMQQIYETCSCGAFIKITSEYPSGHLKNFHEQHKTCVQKPIKNILSLNYNKNGEE